MKILGICGSQRKWKNSEILVRHALNGASENGSETKFIRLPNLEIHQCTGCFNCLRNSVDCILNDQFKKLLSALRWSDGLVLGTPVYFLSSAGSVQTMMSRLFRMGYTEEFRDKPGIALILAGRAGWETFAIPQAALFFRFLGMSVVDHVIGHGQGPGEVLFDADACERARKGGEAVSRGETKFRGPVGLCPICYLNHVVMRPDGSAHCMVCDLPGKWIKKGNAVGFDPDPDKKSRFAPGQIRRHYEEFILSSTDRFKHHKREIRNRLARFRSEVQGLSAC